MNVNASGSGRQMLGKSSDQVDMAQLLGAMKPVVVQVPQHPIWSLPPPTSSSGASNSIQADSVVKNDPAPALHSKDRKTRRRSAGNGLRQFAEDVLRKVERKTTTTYNEVADELVADMYRTSSHEYLLCEEKNIRRRVYDALNVLLAMKIITKERKLIRWSGMPANQTEQKTRLEKKKRELQKRVSEKRLELNELIVQEVAFANLVERNRELCSSAGPGRDLVKLHLPFIVVNTKKETSVDCWMSSSRDTYVFNFNDRFEMHDDVEVLKRSGMAVGLESGKCHGPDLERALKLIDVNLRPYIIELALKNHLLVLNQSLPSLSDERVTSALETVVQRREREDNRNKDYGSIVISETLRDSASASATQSAGSYPSCSNVDDEAYSLSDDDRSSSEDDDDNFISDDSDVEPSV